MSYLWKQRTQDEKEQKKNLEEVNQLLLESILPTKVSKYYMEEEQSAVCLHINKTLAVEYTHTHTHTHTHMHTHALYYRGSTQRAVSVRV